MEVRRKTRRGCTSDKGSVPKCVFLTHPMAGKEYFVTTDAKGIGIAAILSEIDEN